MHPLKKEPVKKFKNEVSAQELISNDFRGNIKLLIRLNLLNTRSEIWRQSLIKVLRYTYLFISTVAHMLHNIFWQKSGLTNNIDKWLKCININIHIRYFHPLNLFNGFSLSFLNSQKLIKVKYLTHNIAEIRKSSKSQYWPFNAWWPLKSNTYLNLHLSAVGLFKYVWPFSEHQALKG